MALSKAKDLRKLSDDELSTEISSLKRELFDLRFNLATRRMETGFHQFKHARRKLAQLMTIERERQLKASVASNSEDTVASGEE
ncbi:50S ribosomal protein L29 [Leptothoe kymatousa]|uniref:Large ribosomal subunit protein uL29 n=1 Tax=Leptothoe kymatousa TAU-MAC 1615 TaxID=2364775 RepID=A0ABS5Y4P1_9CYAN|nr:50S ribosomal protein L29 [Leptothoe kymatousa]MBT9312329.1 50S ribosomal protein L29 [Leptothoe kymatousa TAU-MAC 1615]